MPMYLPPALTLDTDFAGILDGNFDFWTVNTSFAVGASDVYTSDMWIANAGTGGAATVSQNIVAIGTEPSWITTPRKYQLKYQQTTAASVAPTIGEKFESVLQYNGDTITISGTFAVASNGSPITAIRATQNFGTGGSPSATVVTTQSVTWPLTTNESYQFAQIAIPSIAGKVLGTNGNDYLRLDLVLATGQTFTLFSSQIQIDHSQYLPFRYRGYENEIVRTSRYLFFLGSINSPLGFVNGFNNGGGSGVAFLPLPVTMRASPACSVVGGAITWNGYNASFALVTGTASVGPLAPNAIQFSGSGVAVQTGYACYFAASAPSSKIIMDARL